MALHLARLFGNSAEFGVPAQRIGQIVAGRAITADTEEAPADDLARIAV